MKKIVLFIICAIVTVSLSINASVTIRFWDNGVLVHTAYESEGRGVKPLSMYCDTVALHSAGHLVACEGYTFEGWRLGSPVITETTDTADVHFTSTVNIQSSDIDLYAVYKKDVTCYERIINSSGLTANKKYLIVGQNGSSYYAMRGDDAAKFRKGNESGMSGLYSAVVSVCATGKIYTIDNKCIWKLGGTSGSWTWQNQGTTTNYFQIYAPLHFWGQTKYIADMLYTSESSMVVDINSDNGVVSMYYDDYLITKKIALSFAPSISNNTYFGANKSNVFIASDVNNSDESLKGANITKGNIYLYQEKKETRYLSKCCGAYTLHFKACGEATCGSDLTVSAASLTETKNVDNCTKMVSFTGVNPTSVTASATCSDRWTFAGWDSLPCADKTADAPSMVTATAYPLYHNHDTLYAVYQHKTNGSGDYYSSYPDCIAYEVTFDPVNGTVNSSSTPIKLAESPSAGSGVSVPAASFSTCTGWTFAGWAKTPCTGAASAPDMVTGSKYYPAADGETLYAVYKKNSLWTSYPMCDPASITLDAGTGTVGGNTTMVVSEPSISSGITLSTDAVYPTCDAISIWTFVGWSITKISGNTMNEPTLYAHNSLYRPTTPNADVLYAVYRRGTAGNYIYTSMPGCTAFHVILNNNGTEETITESSLGAGVTFPAAAVDCSDRWTFAGWKQASPVEHSYTLPAGLYAISATYTPAQDNETFFAVFKHNTTNYWTSNPDCTPYTIYLHTCEGYFAGGYTEVEETETTAGAGITLPNVTPRCTDRGWSFLGWVEGGELSTTNNISGLPFYAKNTNFKPVQNNVHLYAVYAIDGYKQVTSTTELNTYQNSEFVIAFYWDYGNQYAMTDFALSSDKHTTQTSNLDLKPIASYYDHDGNKYVSKPSDKCKWNLEKSGSYWKFKTKIGNNTYYLYSVKYRQSTSVSTTGADYTIDLSNHRIGLRSAYDAYKYLHFLNIGVGSSNNPTFYVDQNANADRCDLYRATGTLYSSWPHCVPYTVHFDGCDGEALEPNKTESEAGLGITLPGVKNTCDGWEFAGWATEIVENQTSDLTINLHPAGALYVPDKDNITLYAVYQQLKNGEYDQISSQEELLLGRNYIIKNTGNNTYAMGNSDYDTWNNRQISLVSIDGTNYDIVNWRLQGTHDAYALYNVAAAKYLDLITHVDPITHVQYATLQDTKTDNFSIIAQGNGQFYIRTNKGVQKPYLYSFNNRYYDINASAQGFYLLRQKATYWSYPCSTPVEPLAWGNGTVTVESFDLSGAPTAGSVVVGEIESQEDGTYLIHHTGKPGRRLRIAWGGHYYTMTIPYVASTTNTPAVENLPNNDLAVLPNAKFTVGLKTWLHTVTVYEDASLIIAEGDTLFVDTLYLRSVGADKHPTVTFAGPTAAIVVNSGIVYHDRRIDYRAYYPFGMPYDANISEVRFAGLIATAAQPVYRSNYWIKYYDGETRAKNANEGTGMKDTYWEHVTGNTLKGGIGYSIAIADDYTHTARTLRFAMRPMSNWQKYEGGENDRAVTITPSKVNSNTQKHHSGWNYICNPYLHTYYPGTSDENSGLVNGRFEQKNGKWVTADDGTQNVPYLTFYDVASRDYYQKRADNSGLKPFSPVFVQVEDYDMLLYKNPFHAEDKKSALGLRRSTNPDEPRIIKTGLLLIAANGRAYDEMGLVISNRYTNEYEIGADLAKERAKTVKLLHVYTMNATHALAYNALDEQSAAQPIPVGVRIPQTGSYTFRFDEFQYNADDLEALYLTDYEKNVTVDLLDEDYTCTISQGVNEERFAINAILHKETNTPTDVESVSSNGIQVLTNQDGSITICSNNRLTQITVYDVAGRLVEEAAPNAYQWTLNLPQGIYAISLKGENSQGTHIKICSK